MKLITIRKHILYALLLCCCHFTAQSQTTPTPEPRFKTFQTGQAFTSITSDTNNNVWAGTTSQGIFFLDQTLQNPTFSVLSLGTAPVIGTTRMTSMARDKSGNIWVAHEGINTTGGQGGIEKINVTTLAVQHFGPGINARGFSSYSQGDGIPTRRVQQIVVDPNNKVWSAHRYHDVTSAPDYIVTPGSICSRMADADGPFTHYSTWRDWQTRASGGIMLEKFPYPAYTYNPPINVSPDNRNVNAISVDRGFIYMSVFPYNSSETFPIYNSTPITYNKPRLLKYTNTTPPQFVKEYTTQDAYFPTSGGIFHAVYSNKNKGVWVTTPSAGNGFSVWVPTSTDINGGEGLWYNVTDPSIVPPGTIFNKGAIWGDTAGRVFMGTNKGIIVYNGSGEVHSPYAYTLFTKDAYDSPLLRAVHDPTMLSNNITSGCIESESTEEFSWIATPAGIMRLNLPIGDVYVYHVDDKEQPFKEKINGKENYEKMANLLSTHISIQYSWGIEKEIPSFAVDGTKSSVLRLKTDDPGGYYAQNPIYKIELRKETSDPLPGDPNSPEYIDRYGKLTLKPIADYEGQPQVQDLKYVDFIYEHPKYIEGTDFVQNKHYTNYDIFVFKRTPQQTDVPIFRHPIRLCLPPVLFGHGVWSNTASLQQFEDYFRSRGYTEYETGKAWRLDAKIAENHFYRDAHIIPTYIKGLIKKAIDGKVSAGKVNVIVHSRGGLYTRAYIEEIKPDITYKKDINALVTLNTPHFGSQTANGILDKRILLSGLQKTILLASILPQPLSNLSISNEINYGPTEPLRIGDLFSVAAPKADRENHYGAKNLTVENDYISGALDASTWFVPKLNSPAYRNKMQGIPFHAVATNFSLCQLEPILCNGSLALSGAIFALPKKIFWIKLLLSATNFALNTLPQGADAFMSYIYNGPSDAIVPRASMRANLADQFVSTFDGQNVCHVDTGSFLNSSGVTTNAEIQGSIFLKLKQKFNLQNSNTNFTKEGITAPLGLNYTFLAGFQGQTLRQANNTVNNSKVLIHPNSFIPELKSGVNTTFDVYQENVDKIMIEITSNKDEDNTFYYEREVNLEFKNNFSFQVPANIFGNIKITAYGFKEGKMTAIHELDKTIEIPTNVTLQSIKFAENVIEVSEKNQHRFKLLGMYSDNVEREINDLVGVTYTIEKDLIISRTDSETIKTNIPGQSKLTATIASLTAISRYDVVEDIALKKTIITDYFAEFQQTGPIKLNWKSLIEYNSNKFILERSTDNITFTEINQQNGLGISYDIKNYNYIDNTTDDIVYYRLKATDIFNTEVFNQTIQVNRSPLSINDAKFNSNKLVLSPNPLTENTGTLSVYSTLNDDNASLNIYTIS
ncbi:hypothetical protein, partial [Flavobacterium sp.]|uniref:alpha/beta hydrolase n=1 Tax=Flavobacterium sp. TaxID=239 RepID=UPI00286E88B5